MICPQCQRENQFPGPGLCPECYRLWKDDMRARFGPGPWPAQQGGVRKESSASWLAAENDAPKVKAAAGGATTGIERSVIAVIERLGETENDSDLLFQVNAVLREVTMLITRSALMN